MRQHLVFLVHIITVLVLFSSKTLQFSTTNRGVLSNFQHYCSPVTQEQGGYSAITYYMNNVLHEGQMNIRSLNTTDDITAVRIHLSYNVNVTLYTLNSTLNKLEYQDTQQSLMSTIMAPSLVTPMFRLRVKVKYNDKMDKYYKKRLAAYYTFQFTNIVNQTISFQSVEVYATDHLKFAIITANNSHLCNDFSHEETTVYYFQIAFSIASIVVASIHILHGIFLFVLQIALSRQSLMRSRLLSEVPSGIAVNISDLLVLIMYSIDLFWIHKYGIRSSALLIACAYVRSLFIYIACASYVLNCLRYLLMLNIYYLIRHEGKLTKFHKSLTSKAVFIAILALFVVVMLAVCVITFSVVGIRNLAVQSILVTILAIVSCVAAILMGLFSVVLEMLTRSKTIRKYGVIAYFKRDPLYIRLQMLLLVFLIFIGIAYGYLFAFLEPNFQSINLSYGRVVAYVIVYLLFGITLRVIMAGAFIWPLQLYSMLVYVAEDISEVIIEHYMSDPECYDILYEYCRREFSLENLVLWKYLQGIKDKPVEHSVIVKISNTYIRQLSPIQVNFPSHVVNNFLALQADMEAKSLQHVPFDDVYCIVKADLLLNLEDTFKRFRTTAHFKEWQLKNSTSKELIDKQFTL